MTSAIHLLFAASLDGYIADHDGGVGFLDEVSDNGDAAGSSVETEGEDHYERFFAQIDTLVMGRKTYAFLEEHGSWPYGNRKTYVVTHRPIPNPLCALETRDVSDYAAFAAELRRTAGAGIWIVGGGEVMRGFLNAGAVDRMQMTIMPVALGGGIPMFADGDIGLHHFTLESVVQQPDGVVHLRYIANRSLDKI